MAGTPEHIYRKVAKLVDYCPETGAMVWRRREGNNNWNARCAGNACGSAKAEGYLLLGFRHEGCRYNIHVHRLAWFIAHGALPDNHIDHINRDPQDNRLCNLRDVSPGENARNMRVSKRNKTGVTGVHKRGAKRWDARPGGVHIGVFPTKEKAAKAVRQFYAENGYTEHHGVDVPDHLLNPLK